LELCAGAGHIGLAAAVLADRDLIQVEADPVAAEFARFNACRAGWGERTHIRATQLQTALLPGETFDLVVADPPYLASAALDRWPEDPRLAIDGGADGLDLVRACLAVVAECLAPSGSVLLQVAGPAQADHVGHLLRETSTWSLRPLERCVIDDERAIVRIGRR
jgi:release factor glutamine methyltransferase